MQALVNHSGHSNSRLRPAERHFANLLSRLADGRLEVRLPSGNRLVITGSRGEAALRGSIHLHNWRAIWRCARGGSLGLAEAYMDGDWSSPDLTSLLELLLANEGSFRSIAVPGLVSRLLRQFQHFSNRNSRRGSRRNIAHHYDLGNDFYRLWLDESMTYSSALYDGDTTSLGEAQANKYRRLAETVGIRPGSRVLEIGCGWGGFAEWAAATLDCRVTGITLSREQLAFARARIESAGLTDKVSLQLMDYRDLAGSYDHIVSIEMLEAVGVDYWPGYFSRVRELLKPGGRAGIQVITIDNDRFEHYRRGMDFIQKYIFPGGMLPSDARLREEFERADLALVDRHPFGDDYRRTLLEWEYNFNRRIDAVLEQGYDERFIRMWRFYLAYCQAGFARNTIDVVQYVLSRDA